MENSALLGGNMLVILEGVDGSGKTTLCNQLKEKGLIVEPPVGRLEHFPYSKWLALMAKRDITVVDRSFITELVYRTVDGKFPGTMNLAEMCGILEDSKIILCETDTAFEDSMVRGEDNITNKETSKQIQQVYQIITTMLSKFTEAKMFTYDWKHQTVDDVLKFIYKEE